MHARELADGGHAAERREVTGQAVTWYLDRAVAADLVVIPGRWQLSSRYEQARQEPPAFDSVADALSWLETELPGLAAAVAAAHEGELHEQAWQLCEALRGLFQYRRHYAAWIEVTQAGLASARACRNVRAEARMSDQLGFAFLCLHRYQLAQASSARPSARPARPGICWAKRRPWITWGVTLLALSRPGEALTLFEAARVTHMELGRQRGAC